MLARIVHELSQRWEVRVLAPASPATTATTPASGVTVRRTRAGWGGPEGYAALAEMTLRCAGERVDIVVAGHAAVLPAAIAGGKGRVPVVGFLYGSELWNPPIRRLLHGLGSRVTAWIAISEFTAREAVMLGLPAERVHVAPPGADICPVPDDADDRLASLCLVDDRGPVPFFLTVSRLAEPHKGHEALLRIAPALRAVDPRFRYVVCGDGPLRARLQRTAAASGSDEIVTWTGEVDEATKAALLAGCRALTMVSREARGAAQFEGFGLVYLEAGLHGRPSIAGRAGGVTEVVDDGESGLLVDPDDPIALFAAGEQLLRDTDLADRLGRGARRRASDFTWPRCAAQVEAVIEGVTR